MPYHLKFVVDGFFNGSLDEQPDNEAVMLDLLTCLINIDIRFLKKFPATPSLYSSGVIYIEELPGQEDWRDVESVLKHGGGDCEDLACWRIAELRMLGVDARPRIEWKLKPDGNQLYHIQVRLPTGEVEDPSTKLGMKSSRST